MLHLLPPGWSLRVERSEFLIRVWTKGPGGREYELTCDPQIDDWRSHEDVRLSIEGFVRHTVPLLAFVSEPEDN